MKEARYVDVRCGARSTVLVRSDGTAVAFGTTAVRAPPKPGASAAA